MRMNLLIAKVECQVQLRVGDHYRMQVRVQGPGVRERAVELHRVRKRAIQPDRVERTIEARTDAHVSIAQDRPVHLVRGEDDRCDAAVEAREEPRAWFEETRLPKLGVEATLGEQAFRRIERREPGRVENDARLELKRQATQSAHEFAVFPAT